MYIVNCYFNIGSRSSKLDLFIDNKHFISFRSEILPQQG